MIKSLLLFCATCACYFSTFSQVNVTIYPATQKYIGDVSTLDRSLYFNIHNVSENDDEFEALVNDYNVGRSGRRFWGPHAESKQKGYAIGTYKSYTEGSNTPGVKVPVGLTVSTQHPSDVIRWDTDPVAAGKWAAEYYMDEVTGERPKFFEPINEPFVHASDDVFKLDGEGQTIPGFSDEAMRIKMTDFFKEIGKAIHSHPELSDMEVIGYSSAWPMMEKWDFGHWDGRMKMFMDRAGEHMDAFATHLYDGINVTGDHSLRSGSNSEAILDLIETYSMIKWGFVKPHAISEYGGIEKGYPTGYSDVKSIQSIKSINHILFNLLNRQDRLAISIPFITGKATWHLTAANNYQPYGAVLWIPTTIGQAPPSGNVNNYQWEYSSRINFFKLWKDVSGDRVLAHCDNPDIQIQSFVEGDKLFVCLNNLDDNTLEVNLKFSTSMPSVETVSIKSLKIFDNSDPIFKDETSSSAPSSIELIAGETTIITYDLAQPVEFDSEIDRVEYYTANHLQSISANTPLLFDFNGVETGNGYAFLKMGVGRLDPDASTKLSKRPIVKVNGVSIVVPDNWAGYDQSNRSDGFFGTINVPVPIQVLKENNSVEVMFKDGGGRVSHMILVVDRYNESAGKAPILPAEVASIVGVEYHSIGYFNDAFGVTNITTNRVELIHISGNKYAIKDPVSDTYLSISGDKCGESVLTKSEGLGDNGEWIIDGDMTSFHVISAACEEYALEINPTNSSLLLSPYNSGEQNQKFGLRYDTFTGLRHDKKASIKICPNPNRGIFIIESNDIHGIVKIYNTLGTQIASEVLAEGRCSISLEDAAPGIYIAEVLVGDRTYREKMMVN